MRTGDALIRSASSSYTFGLRVMQPSEDAVGEGGASRLLRTPSYDCYESRPRRMRRGRRPPHLAAAVPTAPARPAGVFQDRWRRDGTLRAGAGVAAAPNFTLFQAPGRYF